MDIESIEEPTLLLPVKLLEMFTVAMASQIPMDTNVTDEHMLCVLVMQAIHGPQENKWVERSGFYVIPELLEKAKTVVPLETDNLRILYFGRHLTHSWRSC